MVKKNFFVRCYPTGSVLPVSTVSQTMKNFTYTKFQLVFEFSGTYGHRTSWIYATFILKVSVHIKIRRGHLGRIPNPTHPCTASAPPEGGRVRLKRPWLLTALHLYCRCTRLLRITGTWNNETKRNRFCLTTFGQAWLVSVHKWVRHCIRRDAPRLRGGGCGSKFLHEKTSYFLSFSFQYVQGQIKFQCSNHLLLRCLPRGFYLPRPCRF
jgi:hypothetical protein